MRVILVPPPEIVYNKNRKNIISEPPLGLFCLSAVARQKGHSAYICDLNIAFQKDILPYDGLFHKSAADYILSFSPEMVGFSTICSSFPASLLICKHLKRNAPELPVVFGGPHATAVAIDLLNEVKEIDFVLTGEADFPFPCFLERLNAADISTVPGLVLRKSGKAILNVASEIADVNLLPFPAYDLWPFKEALQEGWFRGPVRLEVGRGCPYGCSFCSSKLLSHGEFRLKSPQRIVKEMEKLYRQYGFTTFTFTHDCFIVDREKVIEITHAIRQSNIPDPKWTCNARIDNVDEELLSTMGDSGCKRIFFGLETGSERLQHVIGKKLNLKRVNQVIKAINNFKMTCDISLILGFPEEDWTDIEATMELFSRYAGTKFVLPQIHVLSPHPGTKLTKMHGNLIRYDGYFADSSYYQRDNLDQERHLIEKYPCLFQAFCFFSNPNVSREELIHLLEFSILLVGSLPGLIPFIRATHGSLLEVIRRWITSVKARELSMPSYNNFFADKENDAFTCLSILLEEVLNNPSMKERELSFIKFWKACLGAQNGDSECSRSLLCGRSMHSDFKKEDQTLSLGSVESEYCSILVLEYDVFESIRKWREEGKWLWPNKRNTVYLIGRGKNLWPATLITDITETLQKWHENDIVHGLHESENYLK